MHNYCTKIVHTHICYTWAHMLHMTWVWHLKTITGITIEGQNAWLSLINIYYQLFTTNCVVEFSACNVLLQTK